LRSRNLFRQKRAQAIQIYCDDEGLAELRRALDRITQIGHLHLYSRTNGGKELAEQTPLGDKAIQEVIITYRKS